MPANFDDDVSYYGNSAQMVHVGSSAPSRTDMLWLDTSAAMVPKCYDSSLSTPAWVPVLTPYFRLTSVTYSDSNQAAAAAYLPCRPCVAEFSGGVVVSFDADPTSDTGYSS